MRLSTLLGGVTRTRDNDNRPVRYRVRAFYDCDIDGLDSDSRTIRGNSIFFALRGAHSDGHRFIDRAIANGAKAVVCSRRNAIRSAIRNTIGSAIRHRAVRRRATDRDGGVSYIFCKYPQLLMSACAHILYDRPSHKMCVIGVTGTDGKSTTAYFVYQLLNALGVRCGLISTVMVDTGEETETGAAEEYARARLNHFHQTTPNSPHLHRALASMSRAGYSHAIVETSSHALAGQTARVAHIAYNGAIVTNISSEHLEFHRTRARYRRTKARLLRMVGGTAAASHIIASDGVATGSAAASSMVAAGNAMADDVTSDGAMPPPFALIGGDDATQRYLRAHAPRTVTLIDYRIQSSNPLCTIRIVDHAIGRTALRINAADSEVDITVPFFGMHNIQNVAAALHCAHMLTTGQPIAAIAPLCASMRLPRGRLQQVSGSRSRAHPYYLFIDYAHTAASIKSVLSLFRPLANGKLVVLFGSAGERDVRKRAMMGRIAAQYADVIYLCDEDPRGEERAAIVADIVRGINSRPPARTRANTGAHMRRSVETHIILDREQAIAAAIATLAANDILLLLGKGHEQSIMYADREMAWDEERIAKKYL